MHGLWPSLLTLAVFDCHRAKLVLTTLVVCVCHPVDRVGKRHTWLATSCACDVIDRGAPLRMSQGKVVGIGTAVTAKDVRIRLRHETERTHRRRHGCPRPQLLRCLSYPPTFCKHQATRRPRCVHGVCTSGFTWRAVHCHSTWNSLLSAADARAATASRGVLPQLRRELRPAREAPDKH